jgi:hypothetical protein
VKKALACGAGGFIGGRLVKKLKREGYWVRGVDIKEHEFAPTQADEFLLLDLRETLPITDSRRFPSRWKGSAQVSSQYSGAQICRAGFLPVVRTARMETQVAVTEKEGTISIRGNGGAIYV